MRHAAERLAGTGNRASTRRGGDSSSTLDQRQGSGINRYNRPSTAWRTYSSLKREAAAP